MYPSLSTFSASASSWHWSQDVDPPVEYLPEGHATGSASAVGQDRPGLQATQTDQEEREYAPVSHDVMVPVDVQA